MLKASLSRSTRILPSSLRSLTLRSYSSSQPSFSPSSSPSASSPIHLSLPQARSLALQTLQSHDRSSYILHNYFPKPAQDAFLAIKLFDLEMAKIGNTVSNKEIAKVRYEFWRKGLQHIFKVAKDVNSTGLTSSGKVNTLVTGGSVDPVKELSKGIVGSAMVQEPLSILLLAALTNENIQLSKRFFITLIQSRETYSLLPSFRSLDSMASYGEGTFSQVNYLLQEACYSVNKQVDDFLREYPQIDELGNKMVAHVGQATGIASLLKGFVYHGRKGWIVLPVDLLAKHDLSQHTLSKMFNEMNNASAMASDNGGGNKSPEVKIEDIVSPQVRQKLSDIVFESATRANDHIISASSTLKDLKLQLSNNVPDAIFVPALNVVPTKLYLERLEQHNFDILNPKLLNQKGSDWKLPYRSYKAYKLRSFE